MAMLLLSEEYLVKYHTPSSAFFYPPYDCQVSKSVDTLQELAIFSIKAKSITVKINQKVPLLPLTITLNRTAVKQ